MGNLLRILAILFAPFLTSCPPLGIATGTNGAGLIQVQPTTVNLASFALVEAGIVNALDLYKIDHPNPSGREAVVIERLIFAGSQVELARAKLASGQAWEPDLHAALDAVRALALAERSPYLTMFVGVAGGILALLDPSAPVSSILTATPPDGSLLPTK